MKGSDGDAGASGGGGYIPGRACALCLTKDAQVRAQTLIPSAPTFFQASGRAALVGGAAQAASEGRWSVSRALTSWTNASLASSPPQSPGSRALRAVGRGPITRATSAPSSSRRRRWAQRSWIARMWLKPDAPPASVWLRRCTIRLKSDVRAPSAAARVLARPAGPAQGVRCAIAPRRAPAPPQRQSARQRPSLPLTSMEAAARAVQPPQWRRTPRVACLRAR